jgi:hypothetical protein
MMNPVTMSHLETCEALGVDARRMDAKQAFDRAIKKRVLSTVMHDYNFAGNYMYMGWSGARGFAFKNIIDRSYTYCE